MWSLWLDTAVNLIDWQAIQQILDVHDCVQVWICGGKRWHSWCLCLVFSACMLAATLHLSPKVASPNPRPHFHLSLTFLCCHSLFWMKQQFLPGLMLFQYFLMTSSLSATLSFGIRFISDQSAELKQNCQVVLCYYIFWFIFRFLLNWRVESCFYQFFTRFFLMRLLVYNQAILSTK